MANGIESSFVSGQRAGVKAVRQTSNDATASIHPARNVSAKLVKHQTMQNSGAKNGGG
jgi:hypothetical protein